MLKKLADAYKLWHGFLEHLSRIERFTLGVRIDALFSDTLELIIIAGYAAREQKTSILKKTCSKLDCLKFFVQLAWETKTLDHKKYAALAAPLTEAGKMLGGWIRHLGNTTPPDNAGGGF